MKKNLLIDAMDNIDDTLLEDYFKTEAELSKKKSKSFLGIHYRLISAACFVLVLTASLTVYMFTSKRNAPETSSSTSSDTGGTGSTDIPSNDDFGETDDIKPKIFGNSLSVSADLYEALSSAAPSDMFTLVIYTTSDLKIIDFIYDGKTYQEYYTERKNLENYLIKLETLKLQGNHLKYGEALYTTGLPNGSKWPKEWYEERIEYYGAEILEKYIVDSVFLETKLVEDISETKAEITNLKQLEKTIQNSYIIFVNEGTVQLLRSKGYNAYIAQLDETQVLMNITKEEFLKLTIDNPEKYQFYLISEYDYD